MNLFRFLKPKPTISDQELTTGLRWLTLEGTVSLGLNSITTSGILAAIPFIMQIIQFPAIWLVGKIRRHIPTYLRKRQWFRQLKVPC